MNLSDLKNTPNKYIQLAANISVAVNLLVFGGKIYSYYLTHSTAVLSDAMESVVNVVSSLVALALVRYAAKPADEDHPYGHGKAEYFSSAFEGGMIFFAALMIIGYAVKSLLKGPELKELEMGMIVVVITTLTNAVLGIYLLKTGQKHHSEAMKASGAHVLSDVYTTLGVLVGLLIVKFTGLLWVDPVIAIVVGLNLAYSGFKIFLNSTGALLDKQDTGYLEQLASQFNRSREKGIIDIHKVRMIRSGRFHHIDAHVVVPEFWTVQQAHDVTHSFEENVVQGYQFDGEIAFHVDPCKKSYCEACDLMSCAIRIRDFKGLNSFDAKSLTLEQAPTNHMTHG